MAPFTKGILWGFSGKVGDYMKSVPSKRSGPASQLQLEQQAKFSSMIKFMQPFLGFVNLSFKNYDNKI